MAGAVINVPYNEMDGSPEVRHTRRGVNATRRLRCAWGARSLLARQLMGYTNGAGVSFETATLPDYDDVYVSDVNIAPAPGQTLQDSSDPQHTSYEQAILTVQYKSDDSSVSTTPGSGTERFSESLECAKEFLTLPGKKLYWDSANTQTVGDGAGPSLILPMLTWVYTRRRVQNIPNGAVNGIGLVNAAAVTAQTLGISFAKETLLYDTISLQRVVTFNGTLGWDVTVRFVHRPTGWNYFPNPETNSWAPVYRTFNTIFKPYGLYNFLNIVL